MSKIILMSILIAMIAIPTRQRASLIPKKGSSSPSKTS